MPTLAVYLHIYNTYLFVMHLRGLSFTDKLSKWKVFGLVPVKFFRPKMTVSLLVSNIGWGVKWKKWFSFEIEKKYLLKWKFREINVCWGLFKFLVGVQACFKKLYEPKLKPWLGKLRARKILIQKISLTKNLYWVK